MDCRQQQPTDLNALMGKKKTEHQKQNSSLSRDESADRERIQRTTVLQCSTCFSHRAIILETRPPKAECADCQTIYKIKTAKPLGSLAYDDEAQTTKARRDFKGVVVTHATPPTPKELGPLTEYVTETIKGGAPAHRAAQHEARRLSKRFGLELEAQWLIETPWLKDWAQGKHALTARSEASVPLDSTNGSPSETVSNRDCPTRLRVRAVIARRARFLSFLAVLGSQRAACRKARVSVEDIIYQLKEDHDFMAQAEVAHAYFVDLLHMRAAQRTIEGDCEPVFWQGVEVGHIRKFDSRLQIEMLRAHMPERFKTPGSGPISIDTGDKILVMDEATRMKLIDRRRQNQIAMKAAHDEAKP
jgi:hypothetical protein